MTAHVGNDVVDLQEPDIAAHHERPRFVARVCTAREVEAVAAAADPHRLLWSLFAAKEAAFKALSKRQPGLAFAPRRFAVAADLTEVRHDRARLRLWLQVDAERVHAVAVLGEPGEPPSVEPASIVERRPPELGESEAARALALRWAPSKLRGMEGMEGALEIRRGADERYYAGLGPPRLLCGGRPLAVDLSLSHDGAWVACALLPSGDAAGATG